MKLIIVFLIPLLFLLFPFKVSADTSIQFITIVNPVRISSYTKNPADSLNAQYEEIRKRNLTATWLFTYDAIANEDVVSVVKKLDKKQELGIFMEITDEFARQAKVVYRKTDSWHRANALFLSGYTQEERKKLIDAVFNKFKEKFGFFPTSVGSWWNDSFSLAYMKDKYEITANLTCADQFETDGYHIWGQYWSAPFYPSRYNAGMPARDAGSKLDIVTIQWASRDPLNGYRSSVYSSQDYFTLGFGQDYFEKLIRLYAGSQRNDFGQITVGLEGDLTPESYKGIYASQMQLVSELRNSNEYEVTTMQEFSNWYRSRFKNQTPDFFIESEDLLNKGKKAIWYQSPYYRVGMVYDGEESKLKIIDLRTYFSNFQEPYYVAPNFQLDLFINLPSVIDSVSNPDSMWEIDGIKLQSIEKDQSGYRLNFENNKVVRLTSGALSFENFNRELKQSIIVKNSPYLSFKEAQNTITVSPRFKYPYSDEGLIFPDLSIKATYFLWRPKIQVIGASIIGLIMMATVTILFLKKKLFLKLKLLIIVYLPFLVASLILFLTNYQFYLVNQSEIDALEHLAVLPYGKVALVKDGCLICKWYTKYPPPAFANKKNYVNWLSKKPIVYNSTVFQAKSRQEGREELSKLAVKYIYLVRYEGYREEMPFSPGDLNVERIYENANVQIWKVKEK